MPAACRLDSDSCCPVLIVLSSLCSLSSVVISSVVLSSVVLIVLIVLLIVLIVLHCQVGGAVHGGEDRGKEKARLRKVGVVQASSLGATSGIMPGCVPLVCPTYKQRCCVHHGRRSMEARTVCCYRQVTCVRLFGLTLAVPLRTRFACRA